MRRIAKSFLVLSVAGLLIASGSVFVFGATPAQMLNLPAAGNVVTTDDDETPDVTAKVARISHISGEAQIRRLDSQEWERATLNLPIVEGDEIATGSGSRVEIQFDNYRRLRLAEDTQLKIVSLRDEGIAISLSLGSITLRITDFEKDKAFFEIDAPKTTLAVHKPGTFRIDAGKAGDEEIRVAATDGGEARVYSENAGFTLKNGRSAKVFIEGSLAGEWETADASRSMDEFDSWAADRDRTIAKKLKDAYYDKYYDRDIYGADDLNAHGQWVNTRNYGYVWRPFDASINHYADWSPYRYGHWRWVPPYGWTWINDEPWGWATYHHGRWIYDAGYWSWSPYGHYRWARSWWSPALVVISIFNNNVCWYPLGYHHRYNSYNRHRNRRNHGNNPGPDYPTGGIKPLPNRTPTPPTGKKFKLGGLETAQVDQIPPSGVIVVDADQFGTTTKGNRRAPVTFAKSILAKRSDLPESPQLPVYKDIKGRMGREILSETPKTEVVAARTSVGAERRKPNIAMDAELRSTRVFGGRTPITVTTENGENGEPRRTGVVVRTPPQKPANTDTPVRTPPVFTPRERMEVETPRPPVKAPRPEPQRRDETPSDDAPPVRQPPRSDPPPTRQPPRNDPPPTKAPPRSEPKSEPKPVRKTETKADADVG